MTIARDRASLAGKRPSRSLVLVASVAALAALGLILFAWSGAGAPPDAGVRGRVWLGPLTPLVRGPLTPLVRGPDTLIERPYAATIQVLDTHGRVVATTRSNRNGYFRINLAPGCYVLQGRAFGGSSLPSAKPVRVAVRAHHFAVVTVSFDTGIR